MPFDMLFQGNKDAFLTNAVNKHSIINVILTEVKKPGCNTFHSYDDDVTKLSVQSSLKCHITDISEKRIYWCYCCVIQSTIQNHCTLKVKKKVKQGSCSYFSS